MTKLTKLPHIEAYLVQQDILSTIRSRLNGDDRSYEARIRELKKEKKGMEECVEKAKKMHEDRVPYVVYTLVGHGVDMKSSPGELYVKQNGVLEFLKPVIKILERGSDTQLHMLAEMYSRGPLKLDELNKLVGELPDEKKRVSGKKE